MEDLRRARRPRPPASESVRLTPRLDGIQGSSSMSQYRIFDTAYSRLIILIMLVFSKN